MKLEEARHIIKWHFILRGFQPPAFEEYTEAKLIEWAKNIKSTEVIYAKP